MINVFCKYTSKNEKFNKNLFPEDQFVRIAAGFQDDPGQRSPQDFRILAAVPLLCSADDRDESGTVRITPEFFPCCPVPEFREVAAVAFPCGDPGIKIFREKVFHIQGGVTITLHPGLFLIDEVENFVSRG